MNLALSNLAWDNQNIDEILSILKKNNIQSIECVYTKIKPWGELTFEDLLIFKKKCEYYNIHPYSVQSLFFNIDCKSFNDTEIIVQHIEKIVEFSKVLGVKILVFGSPSLRKKTNNWEWDVKNTFEKIDMVLKKSGIILCIEPNAKKYGGEFFHNTKEIVSFIENNKLKNIKTMIDTHNLILEGLDPIKEYDIYKKLIFHIHVSEDNLNIINNSNNFHTEFSKRLRKSRYSRTITYEVLSHEETMKSVETFSKIYY